LSGTEAFFSTLGGIDGGILVANRGIIVQASGAGGVSATHWRQAGR
jgi:hypothetical protein